MGKKKNVPEETPPGNQHIRLQLSCTEATELRMIAARHGMGMAALARWIVREYLEREATG